jgi:inner membrane protein
VAAGAEAEALASGMAYTHPIMAVAFAAPLYRKDVPVQVWMWGAVLTALPDIDFVGYRMGVPYSHMMGHRGFTHSLLFAAMMAGVVAFCLRKSWQSSAAVRWLFFFLCGASHGLLDGMTNGGLGVAYFSPFDLTRYFLPWRPIPVAPLGPRLIFSPWGAHVIESELVWIWLPVIAFTAMVFAIRTLRTGHDSDSAR